MVREIIPESRATSPGIRTPARSARFPFGYSGCSRSINRAHGTTWSILLIPTMSLGHSEIMSLAVPT
jgi:hypothetical protein